ncbi:MAG: bifunctional oligoribonuclease/PAP phosphatase NrnA [Syntrophomonadaceae bacterium]|nr:bifunctional oligoribonuclease/PAP phosphatase NrnA [Syntrophomonadaceae bacterium]
MKGINKGLINSEQIARELLDRDNFLLLGHIIPDGDCVGSLAALKLGLESMGKKAEVLLQDQVPEIYRFLPATAKFRHEWSDDINIKNVVFIDCSELARVGDKIAANLNSSFTTINIDHHATNDLFADHNWVEPGVAATAELIFAVLKDMQVKLTVEMATALFCGLVMDTGRFMYSSTTDKTMNVAAGLLKAGVDINQVRINLFESKTSQEILLIRLALNNIIVSDDGRIAWITLPYEEVKSIGALGIHPESIINYTREIKGVQVGILFREISPGIIKVGFRAKGSVDVSRIAGKIGGGGHRQAAGATYEGSLAEAKETVLQLVKDVLH